MNVYLEGATLSASPFEAFSHLHLPDSSPANLEDICLRDIRRELARILDIEDPLALQLEIQHAPAQAGSKIFSKRICNRPNAVWNDLTVDDRDTLSKALPTKDAWLRVRVAEHLKITIPSKNITLAFTPPGNARTSDVRAMVAKVAETTPGNSYPTVPARWRHSSIHLTIL